MITNSSKNISHSFVYTHMYKLCTVINTHTKAVNKYMLTVSIRTTVVTLIVPPVRTANGALAVVIKYLNDSVVLFCFVFYFSPK